jgi:hypothetical protein
MRDPIQGFRALLLLVAPGLLINYAMWCGLCRVWHCVF